MTVTLSPATVPAPGWQSSRLPGWSLDCCTRRPPRSPPHCGDHHHRLPVHKQVGRGVLPWASGHFFMCSLGGVGSAVCTVYTTAIQAPRPSLGATERFLQDLRVPARLAKRLAVFTTLADWPLEQHVSGCTQLRMPICGTGRELVGYRFPLRDMQPNTAEALDRLAYRLPLRRMQSMTTLARPECAGPAELPDTFNLPLLVMHCTDYTGFRNILQAGRIPGEVAGV